MEDFYKLANEVGSERTRINFRTTYLNRKLYTPEILLGDKIRILTYLELPNVEETTEEKERLQAFEGIVISKHLSSIKLDSTITIRKIFPTGGTEKIFILNSPWIKSIKIKSRALVKRSKLYYLRDRIGKAARLKRLLGRSSK